MDEIEWGIQIKKNVTLLFIKEKKSKLFEQINSSPVLINKI